MPEHRVYQALVLGASAFTCSLHLCHKLQRWVALPSPFPWVQSNVCAKDTAVTMQKWNLNLASHTAACVPKAQH